MDGLHGMADFVVTTLHFLAVLVLAYGVYVAIYWKDLRTPRPGPEAGEPRRERRDLHVRRQAVRGAIRVDSPAGDPAAAKRGSGLQAQRPPA